MDKLTKGYVHLYVGNGKGKTTAAAGLAVRALGTGRRVLFGQFLKGRPTGEIEPLRRLGAVIERAGISDKFVRMMSPEELAETKQSHRECLARIREAVFGGETDLAILDEVVDAVNLEILTPGELVDLIKGRPEKVELVLTGRNPPPELVELCDYHTDFVCKNHPYMRGVPAREGIEY